MIVSVVAGFARRRLSVLKDLLVVRMDEAIVDLSFNGSDEVRFQGQP